MLEVKDINLFYGAAQALRGVSIAAEPGKVTCVLGRNGVGKTSLLRAMVGQYPISGGSITFDGADITALRPYERARKGIGFVPQGREIFPLLTVEENLKTGFGPLKRQDRNIPDDVKAAIARCRFILSARPAVDKIMDNRWTGWGKAVRTGQFLRVNSACALAGSCYGVACESCCCSFYPARCL